MTSLADQCVSLLGGRGHTVSTAESLTAGMIVADLATVPGASAVLRGGVAAYATEIKLSVLGVDATLVESYGVVSAQCAAAMAQRGLVVFASDWAVASTGVAGPGEQDGHPVGSVFVAVAGPAGVLVEALSLAGDRQRIRRDSAAAALALLASALSATAEQATMPL